MTFGTHFIFGAQVNIKKELEKINRIRVPDTEYILLLCFTFGFTFTTLLMLIQVHKKN